MKRLVLLVLLPFFANAASFEYQLCPDGRYWSDCPAELSSLSVGSIGETSASVQVTTDKASGTLYCLTNQTADENDIATVLGGDSAAVSGSGAQTLPVSGLTADTTYYVHCLHDYEGRPFAQLDGAAYISTTSFATISAGGLPFDLSPYESSIDFSYSWPVEPNITSEAAVTPATLSANNVNGRRLTLAAGSYGDVSPGNDQEWILQAGAEIDLFNFLGSQRVKVRGETPRVGRIGTIGQDGQDNSTSDILFDGVYQSNGPWTPNFFYSNFLYGSRIAIVNSSLNAAGYGIFAGTNSENGINNVIFAGNYLRSDNTINTQTSVIALSLFRFLGVNTYVVAGNYMEKAGPGLGFRIHGNDFSASEDLDSYDGYVGDNYIVVPSGVSSFAAMFVAPSGGSSVASAVLDITIEDNKVYNPTNATFRTDSTPEQTPEAQNIILRDNDFYGTQAPPSGTPARGVNWTVSGNSFQGYQAAPTANSILGFDETP